MSVRPTLILDTCALKHLDQLELNRRPLVDYMVDAFELRVPHEIFEELRRHVRGMEQKKRLTKKKAEWRMRHGLNDACLKRMLRDLPITSEWYEHENFHPNNETHLFAAGQNVGEREMFLLFTELSYSGRTPILLSDDLKACRLALRDLIGWKVRTGVLWITLDFVIYVLFTGLKRSVKKKIVNQFTLKDLEGVIRDLVLRISSDQILQQQLLVHYHTLARMIFDMIDSGDVFNHLEKKYGNDRYR